MQFTLEALVKGVVEAVGIAATDVGGASGLVKIVRFAMTLSFCLERSLNCEGGCRDQ